MRKIEEKGFRAIRFFCKGCGKEMWEDMYLDGNSETIQSLFRVLECSDCILKENDNG